MKREFGKKGGRRPRGDRPAGRPPDHGGFKKRYGPGAPPEHGGFKKRYGSGAPPEHGGFKKRYGPGAPPEHSGFKKRYGPGAPPEHGGFRRHGGPDRPRDGSAPEPWRRPQPRPEKSAVPDEEARLRQTASAKTGLGGYAKFGDIPAHRLGKALRGRLYRLANGLPEDEKNNLTPRLKFAATTITAAIATGFGEGTFRAGVTRALESRGALMGIQDHLDQLHELNLLDDQTSGELRREVDAVVGAVNEYLGVIAKGRTEGEGQGHPG